jgi:hypothetical protein
MAREQIRKSVRFEVFKRDSFTCQYCGEKAPDVVLEVDHITPVAAGGGNDILNLVTACKACNAGKRDRAISDTAAVQKSRAQADELASRRQQLEMIAEWHRGLLETDRDAVVILERLWFDAVEMSPDANRLTDEALDTLRVAMRRYGFDAVCQSISQATVTYRSTPSEFRQDAARNDAFWSIPRRCTVIKAERDNPGVGRLFYIRGILRNRCRTLNESACIALLKEAFACGIDVDWLESFAKEVSAWSVFRDVVNEQVRQCYEDEEATDGTHP